MRYSFKHYLVYHFLLYTGLFIITDSVSVLLFQIMFHESISLWSLLCFRIILNLAAFLLANQFKHTFLYYTVSFAITLLAAIGSGALLPDGIAAKWPWMETFNPIQPFLTGGIMNLSSVIIIILAIIWYVQKEKNHA
jgi:ABC-2 type transport system permease protein